MIDGQNQKRRTRKTMRAKEFFSQYRRINARIDALMEEQARYRSLAERVTTSFSGGGGRNTGMHSNQRENYIISAVDIEGKIAVEMQKLVEFRNVAKEIVDALTDSRYRDILTLKYFSCWEWSRVAEAMSYELSYVYELHGKALLEAQPRIDEFIKEHGII